MALDKLLHVYYQNVRGLRSKTTDFRLNIISNNWDIIALTETWLNSSVYNAELFPDGYQVYRRDRCQLQTGKSRGGGVLVAISNNIKVQRLYNLENSGENLWLRLELSNKSTIILCNVYFPPNSPLVDYCSFFEKLDSFKLKREKILVLGDFNQPISGVNYKLELGNAICRQLLFFMETYNLNLLNNVSNSLGKTLDLVLTDIVGLTVEEDCCPVVNIDKHHPPLSITFNSSVTNYNSVDNNFNLFNFKRADFFQLYVLLRDTDWSRLLNITNVSEAVDNFYSTLNNIISHCVPVYYKSNSKYPPWFDHHLISLIRRKNIIRRKYLKYKFPNILDQYKEIRSRIKIDIKNAFKNHIKHVENNLKSNPKAFWNEINKLRVVDSMPAVMRLDGEEVEGAAQITDKFAQYFNSVYEHCQLDSNGLWRRALRSPVMLGVPTMTLGSVTRSEVQQALLKLKPKTSVGPDGLPPYIFKACSELLVTPLLHIFNISILNSEFPEIWKRAKVTPIFKKGQRSEIRNFRPISILSTPAKVFESILYNRLFYHVKRFINPHQHGFFTGRSITSNLLNFSDFCTSTLDFNGQVDVIYTDFEKAFDKVDHLALLSRLNYFGLSSPLIKLFSSYLYKRTQYVSYNGAMSSDFHPESGVPQGSNLGPLLFIIFIDNITSSIKNCNFLLYADDLKIFKSINNISDCKELQDDLDRLFQWSCSNLKFNINKCSIVRFSRKSEQNLIRVDYEMGGIKLVSRNSIKDLGIIFDEKFSFLNHVISICKSSFSVLGFIRRSSNFLKNNDVIKLLYCSLVRSRLEFGSVIWNPFYANQSDMIENVQKKFLRFLYFKEFNHYTTIIPYSELLSLFNIDSLGERRRVAMLVCLYKLVGGVIDDSTLLSKLQFNVPRLNSRSRLLFSPHYSRTNLAANSPLNVMIRLHNSLPINVDIFSNSLRQFIQNVSLSIN